MNISDLRKFSDEATAAAKKREMAEQKRREEERQKALLDKAAAIIQKFWVDAEGVAQTGNRAVIIMEVSQDMTNDSAIHAKHWGNAELLCDPLAIHVFRWGLDQGFKMTLERFYKGNTVFWNMVATW